MERFDEHVTALVPDNSVDSTGSDSIILIDGLMDSMVPFFINTLLLHLNSGHYHIFYIIF